MYPAVAEPDSPTTPFHPQRAPSQTASSWSYAEPPPSLRSMLGLMNECQELKTKPDREVQGSSFQRYKESTNSC